MSLVKRAESDMLRFSSFTDILVCPVNAVGRMGAGLAGAFAARWPDMEKAYMASCANHELSVGKLQIYYDDKSKNTIIGMVTKQDWRDYSTFSDIEQCCIKLVEYLRQYPFHTVAIPPIFGIRPGGIEPEFAESIFMQYFDPLPNIIHLSMRPDRFVTPPLYLAVVGSRDYTDYNKIDLGVMEGLLEFGLKFEDLSGMVSGGARGVDAIACGNGKPNDTSMTIAQQHGVRAIVCHADWERYGNSAGFLRNRTVEDIATHVVAFVGSKSVGTRGLIALVDRYNASIDKFVAEQIIPTNGDIFDRPLVQLPEKKKLYVCSVSSN